MASLSLVSETTRTSTTTNNVLFIGLNQDHGCFACGTDNGFIIFNSEPLKERFRRDFDNAGIGIVEMLWRCNILALVGGGRNPKYPPNKVMIWDDYQNKCIAELEFRSEVRSVKLRRDKIVVALRNKAFVYNFADLQLLDQVETADNPKGLIALSPKNESTFLAYPTTSEGRGIVTIKCYETGSVVNIDAHESAVAQIVLNLDGSLVATCSQKGTLVRVFDTVTGSRLCEFRRGADNAEIYSIAFHPDSTFLAVSSDKGTIHIYKIQRDSGEVAGAGDGSEERGNRQSSLSFMGSWLGGYFNSQWSFAQFHPQTPDPRSIVCFGPTPNSVLVIGANGSYFKYIFDPVEGGEAKLEGVAQYIKAAEALAS